MRSRTIVSLTLFALVTLAQPLIISRHGSQANSPATKVPRLTKRLASDNSVKASKAQSTQPLPSLQGKPASDYLKKHGLYVRLQNLIEAAQYQIDQQPQAQKSSALRSGLRKKNAAEIYEATNPAQKLRARFNGRDVVLQPLTNKRTTTLQARLRLRSYGYGRRMLTAGAGTMRVDGNRIEISRRLATQSNSTNTDQASSDEIVEWYQNRKDGLEQGFTLAAPPGKRHAGTPLRLRLTVTGEVRLALVDSGKAVELIAGNGKHWLRYDHLMATDASGRQLQTRFRADRKQISLLIDDREAVYPLRIDPLFTQTKKLTASEAAANDRFGYSVATNGDTVVVGAYGKNSNTGAAYIFERNQGGAENWGQVQKLTASDAAMNDQFGWSVAIDVNTVVVGAWLKNSYTGAAYIFKRNQGGVENWGQVQKLTASDAAGGDSFGSSVSINADTVVVGASFKNSNTGAAYIFERNQGGAENWEQVQKLTASDAAIYGYFGYSVSINGNTAVVGSYGKQPGAAYIFERNQGGAENWGQVQKLTASDGIGGDQFGISVAINIDTVAVGANHGNRSGAVYIFERNQNGVESWGQVQEVTADDAAAYDEFGISVAIDGDTLLVGAWVKNSYTGAAYIFERNQNGVEGWGQVQELTANDAAAIDQFGSSVGIDGDTVLVGAVGKNSNTGAAYIFDLTSTSTPTPTPTANASCGFTANLGSPPAPATTGTMTTRLYRGFTQGTCSTNSFPGNIDSSSFPFDAYTLTNSSPSPVCVSVALTVNSQSNANYQIAAFLAPFVATDITNASRYLGDPGISSGTPSPLINSFQFTIPANTSFAIVVFSVNGTAELGGNYTFQVMSTSSFCPAPTPTATPTPPPTAGTAVAYQIDATHSGAQYDTITPPLAQRWSRDLGGQISYPLIVGGRIFVTVSNPSSASNYGAKLYALDEANGTTLWRIDLGEGFGFNWCNAAYEAGRVFALRYDGLLRAFDAASGALLWSKQLPDQYAFWSPPTASGGVVYVGGFGHGTTLYAVNEQDGNVNWSVLVDAANDSSPAVTPTGVFVSYDQVYEFSPQDGSLIWQHSGPSSTPVLFGGRLYVGDSLTETWMFDAPTGALLATFQGGPPPAFSGSTGYFLTGSILKARDAYSGAVRWSFTGDGTLTSAPIVDNGYVYIGSGSGKVYALDESTGANVWTGNLGAVVQTTESPVTRPHTGLGAGDGLVVVPASTLLVAYQSAQPTPTPTPTPIPTPAYSISGLVADSNNQPVTGVTLVFDLNFQGTTSTTVRSNDSEGKYFFSDFSCANNIKITPTKPGYSFSPLTVSFVSTGCVSGSKTADFIATPPPANSVQFSLGNYSTGEGSGAATITVKRSGNTSNTLSVDYKTNDNFSFVECNVNNGLANQRCDYLTTAGTLEFEANETSKTFTVPIVDDFQVEGNETLELSLNNVAGGTLGAQTTAVLTINDNDNATPATQLFVAQLQGAQETPPNGSGATGLGTLLFSNNESSAQVNLSFSDLSSTQTSAHIHGPAHVGFDGIIAFPLNTGAVINQMINLTSTQIAQLKAGLFYFNVHTNNFPDGEIRGQILPNPIESTHFFVRQQYYDFQNREPDQGGFDFWANEITSCGANLECITARRTRVADAFFFEPEFQQTGSYVYRLYRASFGNSQPRANAEIPELPSYAAFVEDRARVVGGAGLAQRQLALAAAFVQRPEFLQKYSANLSGPEFVDALVQTIVTDVGVNLSSQRDILIAHYNSGGRSLVLFHLANDYWNSCSQATAPCVPTGYGAAVDNRAFLDAEYYRGFVASMYFGFLRRDADVGGYNFWLGQLHSFPLRSPVGQHRMVCGALITSQEYQQRFNIYFTRTDTECSAIQ